MLFPPAISMRENLVMRCGGAESCLQCESTCTGTMRLNSGSKTFHLADYNLHEDIIVLHMSV